MRWPDMTTEMKPAMTIKHHLTDQLLTAYAAGNLPEAFSLVVAAHLSLCDECRAQAAALDCVGGAVLERCEAVPLEADSFAATMARIKAGGGTPRDTRLAQTFMASAPQTVVATYVLPKPVRDYIGGDLDAVRWRPAGGGVRQAILPTGRAASARLLHIPAGTAVPDHGHRGMELTLVLSGAFRDQTDRFGPGDVEVADQDLKHTPIADIGADCICLAATDAPLRFSGLLPRIAQPFLRI